jgi:tetratricopeptide (TPR) repeat protein
VNEEGGDPTTRRYFADALGLGGMGCFLRFACRPQEAEHFYNRAIELRRELVRGTGYKGVAESRPRIDASGEEDDPSLLVNTVQIVAMMQQDAGRAAEAERLLGQLEGDVMALAARFPGPEFQGQRRLWANRLLGPQLPTADRVMRQMMLLSSRLAIILDPTNANAHNNVAWALACAPDDPWFDPKQGLAEAQKALAVDPTNWSFWNTHGVAAFRARDWTAAHNSLEKSISIAGGKAHDWFFLAMTHWNQGNRIEAGQCFDRALAALKSEGKDDPELLRFHAEAAALMGLPGPKTDRKKG